MSRKLTSRQKMLKSIFKYYDELPPRIIKQIIDYKLSYKSSLHQYIDQIKRINKEIFMYESALKKDAALQEIIGKDYGIRTDVLIEQDNGYGYSMSKTECMRKVDYLKTSRRSIITRCRCERIEGVR